MRRVVSAPARSLFLWPRQSRSCFQHSRLGHHIGWRGWAFHPARPALRPLSDRLPHGLTQDHASHRPAIRRARPLTPFPSHIWQSNGKAHQLFGRDKFRGDHRSRHRNFSRPGSGAATVHQYRRFQFQTFQLPLQFLQDEGTIGPEYRGGCSGDPLDDVGQSKPRLEAEREAQRADFEYRSGPRRLKRQQPQTKHGSLHETLWSTIWRWGHKVNAHRRLLLGTNKTPETKAPWGRVLVRVVYCDKRNLTFAAMIKFALHARNTGARA
jgi:hypothetical protein